MIYCDELQIMDHVVSLNPASLLLWVLIFRFSLKQSCEQNITPIESRSHFLHIIHDDKNFQQLFVMGSSWSHTQKIAACQFSVVLDLINWTSTENTDTVWQCLYFRFLTLIMSDVREPQFIIQCHKMCFNLDAFDKHVLEMTGYIGWKQCIFNRYSAHTFPSHIQSISPPVSISALLSTQLLERVNLSVTDSITSSAALASSRHLGASIAQLLLLDVTLSRLENWSWFYRPKPKVGEDKTLMFLMGKVGHFTIKEKDIDEEEQVLTIYNRFKIQCFYH